MLTTEQHQKNGCQRIPKHLISQIVYPYTSQKILGQNTDTGTKVGLKLCILVLVDLRTSSRRCTRLVSRRRCCTWRNTSSYVSSYCDPLALQTPMVKHMTPCVYSTIFRSHKPVLLYGVSPHTYRHRSWCGDKWHCWEASCFSWRQSAFLYVKRLFTYVKQYV